MFRFKNDYDKLSEIKTNLKNIIINQNYNSDKYKILCDEIKEIIKNKKIEHKNSNDNNTMIEEIFITYEEKKVYNKKLKQINDIIFNFENKFCEINEKDYYYYTIKLLYFYLKNYEIFDVKNIPKIMNKLICLLKKNLNQKIFETTKIEKIEKILILIKNSEEFKKT